MGAGFPQKPPYAFFKKTSNSRKNLSSSEGLVAEPATSTPECTAPPTKTTAQSFVHSVAWSAASDWVTQIVSWICFFVVVRLLTPADYGLVAMASSIGPFVAYFSGNGIPRAIVTL